MGRETDECKDSCIASYLKYFSNFREVLRRSAAEGTDNDDNADKGAEQLPDNASGTWIVLFWHTQKALDSINMTFS